MKCRDGRTNERLDAQTLAVVRYLEVTSLLQLWRVMLARASTDAPSSVLHRRRRSVCASRASRRSTS
jgi:hypothetical protein